MICYFTCFLFPFFVFSRSSWPFPPFFFPVFIGFVFRFLHHYYWQDDGDTGGFVNRPAKKRKKERKKRKVFLYIPRPVVPYMIDCCDRMSRGLCGNVGAVKKGCRLMYLGLHRWFLAIYPRLAPANESNQSCTNLERKQLVAI